jgi:hypothetical protein
MLAEDPKRLQFLGLDMRSRARRRWAVLLVCASYQALMMYVPNNAVLPYRYWILWGLSAAMIYGGLLGNMKSFEERNGVPVGPPGQIPDEREVRERDRASYKALRFLSLMLISAAANRTALLRHHSPEDLTALFLELAVTAIVLPRAIILWNEPDPRQYGELEIVRKGAD